ncbi:MAG: LD-carboxypeptidase, partial [Lentisphaeria bacterium]|nr:LD-carboxypeptidase [Lentisphaeria bacterium]
PFFGYSDTTALQLALWQCSGIKTFSGLLPGVDFRQKLNPLTETYFTAILENRPLPTVTNLTTFQDGKATGILLGGCLSVLCSLLGTPFCPDFSGGILFLEEVNEPTYVIDRLLNQLKSCGILDNLAGLVFGAFTKCEPRDEQEFPLELVLQHYAKFVNGPVCYDLPYGHIAEKVILPIGGQATLNGVAGTLSFCPED